MAAKYQNSSTPLGLLFHQDHVISHGFYLRLLNDLITLWSVLKTGTNTNDPERIKLFNNHGFNPWTSK